MIDLEIPLQDYWLGTAVTSQAEADERIPQILATSAGMRFIKIEPRIGPIDLAKWMFNRRGAIQHIMKGSANLSADQAGLMIAQSLDWVIVGGQTGPFADPCNVAIIRSIVHQCQGAGIPVLVSRLGSNPIADSKGAAGFLATQLDPSDDRFGDAYVRIKLRSPNGDDPSEWPEDLRVRECP